MSYNFKLIVRNGHNEEILDLIDLSSQIKLSGLTQITKKAPFLLNYI